jgi:hypothetical protein
MGNNEVSYEKPDVVDYGSLVELTAATTLNEAEDGIGKATHTDGSSPVG